MKKTIDGEHYDTETATCIGSYEPNPYHTDYGWFMHTLYVTPAGDYFFHCEGYAPTPLEDVEFDDGESYTSGDGDFILASPHAAFDWAQEHLDGDSVDQHFSNLIQDA